MFLFESGPLLLGGWCWRGGLEGFELFGCEAEGDLEADAFGELVPVLELLVEIGGH